jgi:hypothetical protein
MRRLPWIGFVVGAVGVLSGAAGCNHDGDFNVSWAFVGGESAQDGCGRHGVDSVLVTGSSTGGDNASVIALCTPGFVQRPVPAGTWTFALHTVDARGKVIFPVDMPDGTTDAEEIKEGAVTTFPVVLLTPRAQCMDGVDNDGDGLVDLDDPDCGNDPNWNDEASPNPNPLP